MKLTIVIVTHNSDTVIDRCLNSLKQQTVPYEVLIVDSASSDRTKEILFKKYQNAQLIMLPDNLGYAGGNNRGIEKALTTGADFILILNPDTVLLPKSLDSLVAGALKIAKPGIFGPIIYEDDSRSSLWAAGGKLDPQRYTTILNQTRDEYSFIPGACMLISREVFLTGLRFYEPYFMYYEEVELCLQAEKKGFHSYLIPESAIIHYKTSVTNVNKEYYLARNHLLFVERNAPLRVQLHEIARSPKSLYEHIICKNITALHGFFDYLIRHFGKVE